MNLAELEAKVAELEDRIAHDPVRELFRRIVEEMARDDPSLSRSAAKSAAPPPSAADLDAVRAMADEDLRQMRLRRRRGG